MDACLEFFAHTATDQVLKGSPYSVVGKITCLSSSYLSPHPPAPPLCLCHTQPKLWISRRGVLPPNLFWHHLGFDWMRVLWVMSELAVCVLEPPSVWCHPTACKTFCATLFPAACQKTKPLLRVRTHTHNTHTMEVKLNLNALRAVKSLFSSAESGERDV